ncbi:MAG: hypothetical protein LBV80_02890 [Deltaproteobacteria bacterium]|nr:hypothetical protein [Deltaproteobacteria bacterium]
MTTKRYAGLNSAYWGDLHTMTTAT